MSTPERCPRCGAKPVIDDPSVPLVACLGCGWTKCTEVACPDGSSFSLVWPGKGRVRKCVTHFVAVCRVADAIGLPVESLEIQVEGSARPTPRTWAEVIDSVDLLFAAYLSEHRTPGIAGGPNDRRSHHLGARSPGGGGASRMTGTILPSSSIKPIKCTCGWLLPGQVRGEADGETACTWIRIRIACPKCRKMFKLVAGERPKPSPKPQGHAGEGVDGPEKPDEKRDLAQASDLARAECVGERAGDGDDKGDEGGSHDASSISPHDAGELTTSPASSTAPIKSL